MRFNIDRILPDESDMSVNNCVDNQTRKLKLMLDHKRRVIVQ